METISSNSRPLFVRQFSTIDQQISDRLKAAVQFWNKGSVQEALSGFEALASENIPEADMYLGLMHLNGMGVAQSTPQAMEHFCTAMQLHLNASGNYLSHYHRGYLYEKGYAVEQSYENAMLHYPLAGLNHDFMGFVRLAELYEQGFGETKADLRLANTWYEHVLQAFRAELNIEEERQIIQKIAANNQRLETGEGS